MLLCARGDADDAVLPLGEVRVIDLDDVVVGPDLRVLRQLGVRRARRRRNLVLDHRIHPLVTGLGGEEGAELIHDRLDAAGFEDEGGVGEVLSADR
eukprot:COSAG04_NODE_5822_length_1484_cov_0.995668_2_plen_95_part_01